MLVGAAGAFVPVIPGLILNWLVLLGYGFWSGWGPYGFWTMLLTGLAVVAGTVCDQLAGAVGAKKFGASKAGMIGSVVGAILGVILLNIPGLVLGTFFGAMLAEIWFHKKKAKEAADSGLGALLGCLAGGLFKFVLSMAITVAFIWMVLAWIPPASPPESNGLPTPESNGLPAPESIGLPAPEAEGLTAPEAEGLTAPGEVGQPVPEAEGQPEATD
jgi:uncharacterized protein YqgC (DUF456 family)